MKVDKKEASYTAVGVLMTFAIQTLMKIGQNKELFLELSSEMWDAIEKEVKK